MSIEFTARTTAPEPEHPNGWQPVAGFISSTHICHEFFVPPALQDPAESWMQFKDRICTDSSKHSYLALSAGMAYDRLVMAGDDEAQRTRLAWAYTRGLIIYLKASMPEDYGDLVVPEATVIEHPAIRKVDPSRATLDMDQQMAAQDASIISIDRLDPTATQQHLESAATIWGAIVQKHIAKEPLTEDDIKVLTNDQLWALASVSSNYDLLKHIFEKVPGGLRLKLMVKDAKRYWKEQKRLEQMAEAQAEADAPIETADPDTLRRIMSAQADEVPTETVSSVVAGPQMEWGEFVALLDQPVTAEAVAKFDNLHPNFAELFVHTNSGNVLTGTPDLITPTADDLVAESVHAQAVAQQISLEMAGESHTATAAPEPLTVVCDEAHTIEIRVHNREPLGRDEDSRARLITSLIRVCGEDIRTLPETQVQQRTEILRRQLELATDLFMMRNRTLDDLPDEQAAQWRLLLTERARVINTLHPHHEQNAQLQQTWRHRYERTNTAGAYRVANA